MNTQTTSKALSGQVVVLQHNGSLTIMESQQEFEGESGTVVPAKSICMNKYSAKILRDFLNEQYPIKEVTQ